MRIFQIFFNGKRRQVRPTCKKNVLVLIFYIVVALNLTWSLGIIFQRKSEKKKMTNFDVIMLATKRTSSIISVVIISIKFWFRHQEIIEIIKMVSKIRLHSIFINTAADKFINKALKRSIQLLVILVLLESGLVVGFCIEVSEWFCIRILPFIFHSFMVYGCILQSIYFLLFIGQEFTILNETLVKIKRETFEETADIQFINVRKPNLAIGKLSRLHKLHEQLYELSEKVSNIYSIPIFFCFANIFFFLLHATYFTVTIILNPPKKILWTRYMTNGIREALALIFILSLNASASSVTDQVSNNKIHFEYL